MLRIIYGGLVLAVALLIVLLAAYFTPDDLFPLGLAVFGILVIAVAFALNWRLRPR
jgi:hypothetical protein